MSKRPAPGPPAGLAAVPPGEWNRVWLRVRAPATVKAVGWACASLANYGDGADIRPGIPMLATVCGLTDKPTRQALARIREWGLMWRYFEGSKAGRRGLADVYRLTIPDDILTRVPMLTPDNQVTEHRFLEPGFLEPGFAGNGTPVPGTAITGSSSPPPIQDLSTHLAISGVPSVDGSVEGAGPGTGEPPAGDRSLNGADPRTRAGTDAIRQHLTAQLTEWERQHHTSNQDLGSGTCPACHGSFSIMRGGKLREHKSGPRWRTGSLGPPLETAVP